MRKYLLATLLCVTLSFASLQAHGFGFGLGFGFFNPTPTTTSEPAFDPYTLSPTAVYDLSDETAVSTSGNNITGLTDKSGNGHHIVSVGGTPQYNVRQENGLNVADLDGTNGSLNFPSSLLNLPNGANTAIIVWGSDTTSTQGNGGYRPLRGRVPTNSTRWGTLVNRNTSNLIETLNSSSFSPINYNPSPTFDTSTHASGLRFDGVSNVDVLFDGVVTSGSGSPASGIFSMDAGVLVDGYIAEIWLFDRSLTDYELSQTGNWLADKWGFNWGNNVNLAYIGSSTSEGQGSSPVVTQIDRAVPLLNNFRTLNQIDHSTGGTKAVDRVALYQAQIVDNFDATKDSNINVFMNFGGNDFRLYETCVDVRDAYISMFQSGRAAGYKIVATTVTWRTSNDATQELNRNCYNDWLRANWSTYIDAMVDIAARPELGNDSISTPGYMDNYVDVSHFNNTGHELIAQLTSEAVQVIIDEGRTSKEVNIVWHGDSRTDGSGGSGDKMHQRVAPLLTDVFLTQTEYADGGEEITNEVNNYLGHAQTSYDATADVNVSVISGMGINDCRLWTGNAATPELAGQAVIDAWTSMASDGRDEGYLVHISTIPWRTSNDTDQETCRNTANDWLRSNWSNHADGFVDLAAKQELGDDGLHDGDAGDSTYYVDVSHFNDAGQDFWAGYLAPDIQEMINQ